MQQPNKDFKIAHLTSVHPAFDTRIFYKECISLANAGFKVSLIAPGENNEVLNNVKIVSVFRAKNRLQRILQTVWSVYMAAIAENADLYHFHDPELIPVGLALRLFGKRVVYDVHEDVPKDILSKTWIPTRLRAFVANITQILETWAAGQFDAVVTANPPVASRFPKQKTITIHNFPMLREFPKALLATTTQKTKHVGYMGGLSEVRGIMELVKAMQLVCESADVQLQLAGIFSPPQFENTLRLQPGWQHVNYLGWVNRRELNSMLSDVQVGLATLHPLANYLEAYPVKMFEYMAAGIPVVVSDFPMWEAVVAECNCGILVNPMQPDAIANAILHLLNNPDLAKTMGAKGRQAVLEKYNWEQEEQKLISLYHRLLNTSDRNALQSTTQTSNILNISTPIMTQPTAHIAQLTTVHPAYDVRIYHKFSLSLAKAGYKVTLIAPQPEQVLATSDQVHFRFLPKSSNRLERMLLGAWRMWSAAIAENADLYHFHDPELIPVGLALRLFGKRVVYDVHEDVPKDILAKTWIPKFLRTSVSKTMHFIETFATLNFSAAVAATPSIGKHLPAHKTAVVENLPILEEFQSNTPYGSRENIIVYVGGIEPVRGAREMVAAMSLLPSHLNAKLLLAGQFSSEEFQQELKAHPGFQQVEYLGFLSRPEIGALLGRAKIGMVVLHPTPAYVDSLPVKLFEYMITGIPVVASNFPNWENAMGGGGIQVNPLDPQSIADAITWLFEHPEQAEHLGQQGQMCVKQRHWAHEANRLIELYKKLGV